MLHPLFCLSIPIFNYDMLLSLINVLLFTAAFAHAVPQQQSSGPLTEDKLDKLYPKCWVDLSTQQGAALYNVPGRCQIKREGWEKIFTHTLSIAAGCGEQLLFVNYHDFSKSSRLTSLRPELEKYGGVDCGIMVGCGVKGTAGIDGYCQGSTEKCWGSLGGFVL